MFVKLDTRLLKAVRDLADDWIRRDLDIVDSGDTDHMAGCVNPCDPLTEDELNAAPDSYLWLNLTAWMELKRDTDPELARAVNDLILSAKTLDGRPIGLEWYQGKWLTPS